MKKVLRIAGYARVSHDEQKKFGYSIKAQTDKIEKWCNQEGHHLIDIYTDEGFSAGSMKRPALTDLLKNLNRIDAIAFTRLDRLSRNVLDANKMLEILTKNNVALISTDGDDVDTSNADGLFNFQLRVSLAERELKKGSERIKAVFDYKIKNGQPISGQTTLGYKIVTENGMKRVVKNKEESQIVQDIFEHFLTHHSIGKTREFINEKYNLTYCYQVYNRILKSEFYTGTHHGNSTFTDPYISREKFDRIQKIIKKNVRKRKNNNTYIFTSLCRCHECGSIMIGSSYIDYNSKNAPKYYYYRCPKAFMQKTCNHRRANSEKIIESYLLENVDRLVSDHIATVSRIQAAKPDQTAKRIKEIKSEMENLNYMFLKKRIPMTEYDNLYENLEMELSKLNVNQTTHTDTSKLKDLLNSNWRNIYDKLDREHKRSFWRNIIEEIEIDNDYNMKIKFI